MKKFTLMLLLCAAFVAGKSQNNNATKAPYLSDATLPAFNILLMDSTSIFNTSRIPEGQPTVLMYFSPECEHCQAQTEALLKSIDSLQNVHFYLFTTLPFEKLRDFYFFYKLGNYKNFTVGRDYEFFFSRHFESQFVPYLAVYDKHKKLLKVHDGGVKVTSLIEELKD